MKVFLGIIILALGAALIIWHAYIVIGFTIAVWLPKYSSSKWKSTLETPIGHLWGAFFKWVGPIWIVSIFIMVVRIAIGDNN